jgi:hypothetical protein
MSLTYAFLISLTYAFLISLTYAFLISLTYALCSLSPPTIPIAMLD